jgi:4-diphosphocytidyl-2-C-methyl-D-erythritol kinase
MSAPLLRLRAPAKINLFLHVTGRRGDGYHLLQSLAVFADDLSDTLEFTREENFSMRVIGPYAHHVPEENLVTRAAAHFNTPPVHITLTKNIPAGAGLGGGSADAAAAFHGFEQLFGAVDEGKRNNALLALGADVPACYHARPCIFSGIGEVIEELPPLPSFTLLILWPGCHSATKDVFKAREQHVTPPIAVPHFKNTDDFIAFLKTTSNDLEPAAIALNPPIKQALQMLEGAELARMSGSGSAVFGLYRQMEGAQMARAAIQAQIPSIFTAIAKF